MPFAKTALDRAGAWFLNSGIQEPGGGVARYYRSDLARNAAMSTEITGYSASALVYVSQRRGESAVLDGAVRAARFLSRTAWDTTLNAMPFEVNATANGSRPPAYFFDCGIIVRGLLSVWHATADQEWLDAAVRCGRSMTRDFYRGGVIHPILHLPSKEPLAWEARWSRRPGCYQLKSALAWRDLAGATGDAQFGGAWEQALEAALAAHEEFLPGETEPEKVMDRLHAYCYFLEGLLPVCGEAKPRRALQSGIERVSRLLHEISPAFVRSDVYAQLLRARLFAEALYGVPLAEDAAREEADALSAFASESDDPRLDGGFWFGRRRGEILPFMNPVSTAFAAQALDMWSRRPMPEPRVSDLI